MWKSLISLQYIVPHIHCSSSISNCLSLTPFQITFLYLPVGLWCPCSSFSTLLFLFQTFLSRILHFSWMVSYCKLMSPAFTVQVKLHSSLVWITETGWWLIIVYFWSFLRTSALHLARVIYLHPKLTPLFLISYRINSEEAGIWCLSTSPTSFFSILCLTEWFVCATLLTTYHLVFLFFPYHAHETCSKMTTPCSTIFPHHSKLTWHCQISIETFPTPSGISYLSSVYDMVFTTYSLLYVICFNYYTVI